MANKAPWFCTRNNSKLLESAGRWRYVWQTCRENRTHVWSFRHCGRGTCVATRTSPSLGSGAGNALLHDASTAVIPLLDILTRRM
jgi:hypothetical protein